MNYYLAIDLGATSGRHILGWLENGRMAYVEVHRFENAFRNAGGTLCWDREYLFREIITGMKKCAVRGTPPSYIGIDTWGVDYVLLDEAGGVIGNAVSYRDSRTAGIPEQVYELIPETQLYGITGIYSLPFNTIFQLYSQREELANADTILMLPCYFNYLLTGVKANEYTIATTTGLLNAKTGNWDEGIMTRLGFKTGIFAQIKQPGNILGRLTEDITKQVGYGADVVLTGAHDTASAVLAAPLSGIDDDNVFLSSGTWSLVGTQTSAPVTTEAARKRCFTNEGGFGKGGANRLLKNITGLWLLNSVRKDFGNTRNYKELNKLAKQSEEFSSVVDLTENRFLAPKSMTDEIRAACVESGQPVPQTIGEICACVYHSLAAHYYNTVLDLEELTGKNFKAINIVGGGSLDKYLCALTAKYCGKKVFAGPSEATALGNIAAQMLASGEATDVAEVKKFIGAAVSMEEYI